MTLFDTNPTHALNLTSHPNIFSLSAVLFIQVVLTHGGLHIWLTAVLVG